MMSGIAGFEVKLTFVSGFTSRNKMNVFVGLSLLKAVFVTVPISDHSHLSTFCYTPLSEIKISLSNKKEGLVQN